MLKQNEGTVLLGNKVEENAVNDSNDALNNLGQLDETDWDLLIQRIRSRRCTPFIGGEACLGMKQFRSEIVQKWIHKYKDYPFAKMDNLLLAKTDNLPQAAQFVAVKQKDSIYPKDEVVDAMKELLKETPLPDLKDPQNIFRVLAELPFPVYITTNYHDLMEQALKNPLNPKDVRMEFCRWNSALQDPPSIFETGSSFDPTVANPLVYHLYGYMSISESLVLTEDDYFDFLIEVSEKPNLIPPRIQRALTRNSLLFLGYRIFDWDFRILFRIVARYLRNCSNKLHIAVQIETIEEAASVEQEQLVKDYFKQYFESFDIQVYWGSCHRFADELRKRWKDSQNVY